MTPDIHDVFRELTQWHHLDTVYEEERANGEHWTRHHTVTVPPLLQQLADAQPTGERNTSHSHPQSRPAAWLEQLDALQQIERQAAYELRTLGVNDDGNALTVVRRLYATRARLAHDTLERAEIDQFARLWWTQCRVLTGLDQTALRPHNTCPICDEPELGTLRIRRDATGAFCVRCRATWTPENLGLLAEHIRIENNDTEEPA